MPLFQKKQTTIDKEKAEAISVPQEPSKVNMDEGSVKKGNSIYDNADKYREQADESVVDIKEEKKDDRPLEEQLKEREDEAKAIVEIGLKMAEKENDSPSDGEDEEIVSDADEESEDTAEAEEPQGDDKATPESPKADSEVPVPPELIAEALQKGMTVSDVKAMRSPEELRAVLDAIPGKSEDKADQKEEKEGFKLDIDRDEFDDASLAVFDKLEGTINQLMDKVAQDEEKQRQVMEANQKASQQAQVQAAVKEFDEQVSNLPKDLFGEGAGINLPQDSKELANRTKLWNEACLQATAFATSGQEVPSMDKLLDRAMKVAFPEVVEKERLKQLTEKVDQRGKNITLKPSSSKTESVVTKTVDEKHEGAYSAVRNLIKSFGK